MNLFLAYVALFLGGAVFCLVTLASGFDRGWKLLALVLGAVVGVQVFRSRP